ncbi:hypothetical protein [Bacillus sp. SN10]|uniref:hypothetical protein n=1 Tax=Bacillus sp. SN10 TaxID=2056493 RepID=UPI000C3448B8|nr:hypothetical protein [Bacillus sp. SN10]PKJ52667.1 hypothetical protein CWE34_26465 [Bacillus sp. SN10]
MADKYFAIHETGGVGVDAVISARDSEKAREFYEYAICRSNHELTKKYGCIAVEISEDNAERAIGVGVPHYHVPYNDMK